MKILKVLAVIFVVVFLTGASCSNTKPDTPVEIDPSLKQRCPDLPVIALEEMTMGQLYVEYGKLQSQYIECAIRNDCLIEAVETVAGKKAKISCPLPDEKEKTKAEN